jgi:hypothetical protein
MNTSKYKMTISLTASNMRNLFLLLLSLVMLIAPVSNASAQQQYPVKIQPSVTFPSTFLSDYSNPANTNIRVFLSDITKQDYDINLRVTLTNISTKGISYQSKQGINITVDGGVAYFLNYNELTNLFALSDLYVTGGGAEANVLPEGQYSMSLQAYDANLLPLVPVSNALTDFTIFNVVRYDPPLLNAPTDKKEFDLQTTNQNIFFNWTPRHIAYTSQQIQYRYRLIRVLPVDRNPYDALNTSLAGATGNIDVDALDFATFIYSPTDLQLIPGGVYAWQVQAYEIVAGKISTARFKNQGFSEVFTISIKEQCNQITLISPVITASSIKFSWDSPAMPVSDYTEYEFNYRKSGSSLPWTPIITTQTSITLDNTVLQTGIAYEYNVRARCNNWLEPVQGSSITLATPTCVAPAPLTVTTTASNSMLSWTAVTGPDSLQLSYKVTGSTDEYTTKILYPADVQYALPLLTSGGYVVRLDAFCGAETALGRQDTIAYNESGVVGPCPIPMPFELIATRERGKVDTANIKWNSMAAHTTSSITYWHKDSITVKYSYTQLSAGAGVNGRHVYDDQVYMYQIDYLCGTKHRLTPVGMFRILSTSAQLNLDPPTANCFPPVDIRAEARDTVSARVEWDKISGAEGYELSYRIKGAKTSFLTFNTTATNATLKPLEVNAQYQLLVRVKCNGVFSIYSDTALVDLSLGKTRNCDTVKFIKALKTTLTNIQVAWNFDNTCTGYIIKFREDGQPLSSEYTQAFTNIDSLKTNCVINDTVRYTFQNLKSGTKYLLRIQKICGQNNALFNMPMAASTMPDPKTNGTCGSGKVCDKNPAAPLTSLEVGHTIYCADYEIVVDSLTEATSNPALGIYSGLGHMEMPVPGLGDFVNMHVSFRNVKINDKPNSCVYEGTINIDSMNASIIPTKIRDSVKALMAKAQQAVDQANALLAQAQAGIDQLQAGLQQGMDYFQGGDGVGNVKTGKLGDQEIGTDISAARPPTATVNGTEVTVNGVTKNVGPLPALLKDTDGEVFQVTSTGQLTYVGKYDTAYAKNPALELTDQIVTYEDYKGTPKATFDFDAYQDIFKNSIQLKSEYEKITDTYYVPAKFIIPGALDKVTATINTDVPDAKKVVFSNSTGFVYDAQRDGKEFTLNLAGGPASDGQYIYAWYVDGAVKKAIGKLLLPSYAPQVKNVVIIPVKEPARRVYTASIFENYLNATYNKIGITYHVTIDESFRNNTDWADGTDYSIQPTGSSLLNDDYRGKEADVIKAYEAFIIAKGETIDPKTAYFLSVFEESSTKDDNPAIKLLGKMPPEEQFGFLYSGGLPDGGISAGLARTVAHELGHGAYHLEHTFIGLYLGKDSKNTTQNLMDYSTGKDLWKLQWDVVHDPGHVWSVLRRDRDAQANVVKEKQGTISGYVISAADANIRNDNSPYAILQPKQSLQKGIEIQMINLTLSTNICRIKTISDSKLYNTSLTNVTKIIKLDKIENYKIKAVVNPAILPYSSILTGNSLEKDAIVKVNMVCGKYSQIKENTTTNQGWWVETSKLTRMPNELSTNFNWMTNVVISGSLVSTQTLNTIIKNREGINDRTDGEIYTSANKLKTISTGTYYEGKNLAEPTIKGDTDFETQKLKLIYKELNVEGGFSSINTWDKEIFTWGKGLAAKGGKISTVILDLFSIKEKNYEQIFSNVGIKIVNNNLSVLADDGTWKTDNPSSYTTMYASLYIKSNNKLLSFFIELTEKADYRVDIATKMWATIAEGIGKIPDYVFVTAKTGYAESWNDESITVLSHLSHWLPGQSWSTVNYSSTKGKLETIIYNYIYNTVKNTSATRSKTLLTNIYVWNNSYKIIVKLEDFGTPNKGAGIKKVEEKWSTHEIELVFKVDTKSVERAFKKDNSEYITNSNVVIILRGTNSLILTKDQGILTFKLDE